jgi:hypothetical protein
MTASQFGVCDCAGFERAVAAMTTTTMDEAIHLQRAREPHAMTPNRSPMISVSLAIFSETI